MPTFASSEELYGALLPFYRKLVTDPVIAPRFAAADTSFRIRHIDPEGMFVLDATGPELVLLHGEDAAAADTEVELTMSGDDGHRFWLGKLNLPMALARKKIKVEGGVTKLLGIVPALQPAHAMYTSYAAEAGLPVA
jgi:hypothetical protein